MKVLKKAIKMIPILLILSMILCGCELFKTGLEEGFDIGTHGEVPSFRVAYKSDTREFNINNVNLTFCYGSLYKDIPHGYEDATIVLSFITEDQTIEVKRINSKDFFTEKYGMEWELGKNIFDSSYYVFDYSENITIPKELFVGEKGYVRFVMSVEGLAEEYRYLGSVRAGMRMHYKVEGDQIVLSEEEYFLGIIKIGG